MSEGGRVGRDKDEKLNQSRSAMIKLGFYSKCSGKLNGSKGSHHLDYGV